jgi:hypothetical protein
MDPRYKWKAYFHVFFLMRRLVFVMIMIFLNEFLFLQLAAHIIVTLLYISMFLIVKPYRDGKSNQREVFNELCVLAVSYSLISMNDSSASLPTRDLIGTFYVGVCCFNLVLNLTNIAKSIIFESIPEAYHRFVSNRKETEYQKATMDYYESKIKFC